MSPRTPADPVSNTSYRPQANRLYFYARSFATSYQYIVATYLDLQGAAHEAGTDHDAFRTFGKPHISQAFAHFPGQDYLYNSERSAHRGVG
jgi:hypothetical protein